MMRGKESIWLVNKDCAPINEYATHLRTVKQAQYFISQGYDVKVLCSSLVHNTSIDHLSGEKQFYKEEVINGVPFVFVKSLKYTNNGVKRILSYIAFAFNVSKLKDKIGKPNILVHTSRIPFDFRVYSFAKKHNARYILDITDLWPLEFEHFGFLKHNSLILKLFYHIEKYAYTIASHTVFSMEGCYDYIKQKRWDIANGGSIDLNKVHYVNNGIDLAEFTANKKTYSIDDKDLNDPLSFKIIYLGSIRLANNVSKIIDLAKELKEYRDIRFLIYGDGTEREVLEKRCIDENLTNVTFKEKWIEPKYVPYVLSKASINLLNYNNGWGKYGGSMNKLFMALASGKPIVCNAGLAYSVINKYELGIDKEFSNIKEYAAAILNIYNLSKDEYVSMYARSLQVACNYDYQLLCKQFSEYCNL